MTTFLNKLILKAKPTINRQTILAGLLAISLLFAAQSCLVVKEKQVQAEAVQTVSLSPKPEIAMSETILRSAKGDMISYIPKGWFFINVEERISPDVIAVAVNPDYTVSAVFSYLKGGEFTKALFEKEGLMGLARISFAKKEGKTAGAVKLIGKYQNVVLEKSKSFVKFEFSTTGGAINAKSAVFASSTGDFYEMTLVPTVKVTGKAMPSEIEYDKVFRSILTSIQY